MKHGKQFGTTNLLLAAGANLALFHSAHLLHSILTLLALLASRSIFLAQQSIANQPMAWLELLGIVDRVVDQAKAGGLAATELCLKAKAKHMVGRSLVHASQLLANFLLRNRRTIGVQNVHNLVEEFIGVR